MLSHRRVEQCIANLLPDEADRRRCLSLLIEVIHEAHSHGSNKWGVYYQANLIRFLVGNLILFTIHENGIWLSLDKESLDEEVNSQWLEQSEHWQWASGKYSDYALVPSRNGYYDLKDQGLLWSDIKKLHFNYIGKAAKKYKELNRRSQLKFSPDLLSYIRVKLATNVPSPAYDHGFEDPILDIEEFQILHRQLPETEKESLVQSRIGQGLFRQTLSQYWDKSCAVTNCQVIEILRASHIKPWRNSDNKERLDVYNGLLLVPNMDSLFDKGLISFQTDGAIIISSLLKQLNHRDPVTLNIHTGMRLRKIEDTHKPYLEYHRTNVFRP